MEERKRNNLEEIVKSIQEVNDISEEDNAYYDYNAIVIDPYYYKTTVPKQEHTWYTFVPSNVSIKRVPPAVLGENVLGRSFPGLKIVEIRDDLYGKEWEEVLRHEMNHINFPYLTESQIRTKTKQELPFQSHYH